MQITSRDPNKPYFPGQKPSACGHYYPDVLRLQDIRRGTGNVRILDCQYCGRLEVGIDSQTFVEKSNDESMLNALRQSERDRLSKLVI